VTTPAQVSLTARVSAGVAQRIGSLKDPLTIINQSNDQVWLSDTAGVTPDTGVPLPGQTSLQWARPGFLYASLDPAATAPVDLVLSTGVDQWQPSPIAVAAAAAAALFASGVRIAVVTENLYPAYNLPAGSGTGQLDCADFSSFSCQLQPTTVLPFAYGEVEIVQFDGAAILSREKMTLWEDSDTLVNGPLLGSAIEVTVDGAFDLGVQLIASTRPADGPFSAAGLAAQSAPVADAPNNDGVLFDRIGGAIAPAGSVSIELPLRPGRIFARLTAGAANMRFDFAPGLLTQQFSSAVPAGTAVITEIVLPRRATRLTVVNTGGVASTWGAYIMYETP